MNGFAAAEGFLQERRMDSFHVVAGEAFGEHPEAQARRALSGFQLGAFKGTCTILYRLSANHPLSSVLISARHQ